MKKIEEQKYFLALLNRPGDYIFIDISKLDIANNYNPQSLMEIDSFTRYYTETEIKESITRANMASPKYLNGTLVIQDNQKHNPLPLIDKTYMEGFNIDVFIRSNIDNKELMNTICNKFIALSDNEDIKELFRSAIKFKDINTIEIILNNMSIQDYLTFRKLIIYLVDLANREKEKNMANELTRDKAA